MFVNVIPTGALEVLLFLLIGGALTFVIIRVVRRQSFLGVLTSATDLPILTTRFRARAEIRRLFRDRDLDAVLAAGMLGEQKLTFCLPDFASKSAGYRAALKSTITVAPYALAKLGSIDDNGYLDAYILSGAVDPDGLALNHSGPHPNDYNIRGIVMEIRTDEVDGQRVFVYRFCGPSGFSLEAAVEASPDAEPFRSGAEVIGTARLYGYLATDSLDPGLQCLATSAR